MTTQTKSTAARDFLVAAGTGAVAGILSYGLTHGIAAVVLAVTDPPDANIGLGILMMALNVLLVPLLSWPALRGLGVSSPGLSALFGGIIHLALLIVLVPVGNTVDGALVQSSAAAPVSIAVGLIAAAVQAGLGLGVGALAARRIARGRTARA
ncbi:hypothetical protein [Nocardiopsis ansamitocini]|uniref:Uncharacterized protein n=1 Tax=Nocardiopsis ansamitocini TaxID=1670832 RepID=A0A9W6UJU8_9ACTN|nr:hypothetical protein [Nocardiopsis ansamitocini]GLU49067.1 hypothetical protein Nans01_34180 [Nocardiopsis ansamitocini]